MKQQPVEVADESPLYNIGLDKYPFKISRPILFQFSGSDGETLGLYLNPISV